MPDRDVVGVLEWIGMNWNLIESDYLSMQHDSLVRWLLMPSSRWIGDWQLAETNELRKKLKFEGEMTTRRYNARSPNTLAGLDSVTKTWHNTKDNRIWSHSLGWAAAIQIAWLAISSVEFQLAQSIRVAGVIDRQSIRARLETQTDRERFPNRLLLALHSIIPEESKSME